jgi:hypothetical protein
VCVYTFRKKQKKKLEVENTLYGYAKLYLKNRYIQVNDHNVECVRKMKGTLMPVKQRIVRIR